MTRQKNGKPPKDFPADETMDGYSNNSKNELLTFTKKVNKHLCPFKCSTCDLLKEYVKSRYEVVNILEDDSKLIFSPLF